MATLNLAKMSVTGTPGTGTLTLGSVVAPYQTFAAAGAVDGATYSYVIQENAKFECGWGVYTAVGTTLSRVTVFDSSAGYGTKESFTSAAQVFSASLAKDPVTAGRQTLYVSAGMMTPRTTNGPTSGQLETTTNKVNVPYLSFDPATAQYVSFQLPMPKMWNQATTITFQPIWFHPATTTNFGVVWGMQAVAVRDNVSLDSAYGTAQLSVDTGGTTSNLYVGAESAAITVAGTPQQSDTLLCQLYRDATNGSDTMAVNAYLVGARVFITTNAENDA